MTEMIMTYKAFEMMLAKVRRDQVLGLSEEESIDEDQAEFIKTLEVGAGPSTIEPDSIQLYWIHDVQFDSQNIMIELYPQEDEDGFRVYFIPLEKLVTRFLVHLDWCVPEDGIEVKDRAIAALTDAIRRISEHPLGARLG